MDTIVVVGASLAGLRACEELRRQDFSGRIVVISDEEEPFYDRPPLSKGFLAGALGADKLALRAPGAISSLGLEVLAGRRATRLYRDERLVELDDGVTVGFDGLVLATGARPRFPAGLEPVEGATVLRTKSDAVALRARLVEGAHLAIVGGGFLGMEVAATARGLGVAVSLVEHLRLPLEGPLGPLVAEVLARRQGEEGVELHLSSAVETMERGPFGVRLRLGGGRTIEADTVLVATGVVVDTKWLEGSGLELSDGVVCDEALFCAPGIVCAGDVCRFPLPPPGKSVRIEHWTNAAEQGAHAARNLVREEREPYRPVPYFWSDQYDLKLQAVGLTSGELRVEVLDGDLESAAFGSPLVCAYEDGGRIAAAVGINQPRKLMGLRRLIERAAPFEEAREAMASGPLPLSS